MSAELISVHIHYPRTPPLEKGDTPLQSRVPLSVVATNTVWDAAFLTNQVSFIHQQRSATHAASTPTPNHTIQQAKGRVCHHAKSILHTQRTHTRISLKSCSGGSSRGSSRGNSRGSSSAYPGKQGPFLGHPGSKVIAPGRLQRLDARPCGLRAAHGRANLGGGSVAHGHQDGHRVLKETQQRRINRRESNQHYNSCL